MTKDRRKRKLLPLQREVWYRLWPIASLTVLSIFHLSANYLWLKQDTRPPFYDTAGNAIVMIRLASLPYLTAPLAAAQQVLATGPYPPFAHLVAVPAANWNSPDVDTAILAEVIFLLLLIFSTYWIGMGLDSVRAGLLSALLVSLYPIIYGLSRHLLLDVPLTAMVAAALAATIWSDYFAYRGRSISVGIWLGLGMLTKWTFVVFVAGPLMVVGVMLCVQSRQRLQNAGLAAGIGLLIFLPWYIFHRARLLHFLQIGGWRAATLEGDPLIWSQASWTYYLVQLTNQQILLPLTLLFVLGIILIIRNHRFNVGTYMLVAWFVVPYVAFSMFANKDIRYTMPYLPAIALLTGIGIASIRSKLKFWSLVGVILAITIPQFLTLTFESLADKSAERVPRRISGDLGGLPWTVYSETIHIATPPRNENWQVKAIVDQVVADSVEAAEQNGNVQLLVLPNTPFFEPQGFIYTSQLLHAPLDITYVTGIVETQDEIVLDNADYVVTKTGDLGPPWTLQQAQQYSDQLISGGELADHYIVLDAYLLPDGSTAHLFRRHEANSGVQE